MTLHPASDVIVIEDEVAACLHSFRSAGPERCGLLFGTHEAGIYRVQVAEELPNSSDRADCFALDPALVAQRACTRRTAGLELLGAWHTHPTQSGALSYADRRGADAGWLTVVVDSSGSLHAYLHESGETVRQLGLIEPQAAPDQ